MNLRMHEDQGNRRFQDGYAGISSNRACYAAIQTHETDERGLAYYIQSRSDLLYQSTIDMESAAKPCAC
jgi:hypothetical protein